MHLIGSFRDVSFRVGGFREMSLVLSTKFLHDLTPVLSGAHKFFFLRTQHPKYVCILLLSVSVRPFKRTAATRFI